VRAWRLFDHAAPYASTAGFDPIDGAGGLHAAGRWNDVGTPVVYASSNASLAILERAVHTGLAEFDDQTLLELALPDDASVEEVSVERAWQLQHHALSLGEDAEARSRAFGSAWLRSLRTLVLRVPSVIVPFDHNLILNPRHADMARVEIVRKERFSLDPRLLPYQRAHDAGPPRG
jgi:RES domain-containing protein